MSKTQSYVVVCLKCLNGGDSFSRVTVVNESTKKKAVKKVKNGLNLDKKTDVTVLTIPEYEKIMKMIHEMQFWYIANIDIGIGVASLFGMPTSHGEDIIKTLKENQTLTFKDLEKYNPYTNLDIPKIQYDENS